MIYFFCSITIDINYYFINILLKIRDINKYEATGTESKEILENINNCQIVPEKMDIIEIENRLLKFETEYKKFEIKFENNPYNVMMESYDDDVIITRYYGKYFKEDNKLKNYCDIFKKEISEKMSKKTKKEFMIYHPALEYFLKGTGIEEEAIESEGKEPSAKQIQEIISEAKEDGISTILVQPQFPKQSIDIIAKEIPNAKIVTFNTDEEDVFENLRKFVDSLQ